MSTAYILPGLLHSHWIQFLKTMNLAVRGTAGWEIAAIKGPYLVGSRLSAEEEGKAQPSAGLAS